MGRNEISAPNSPGRNLEIAIERRAASVARLSLLVSHQASSRFKELMCDHADLAPENWYWDAFEELEAQGHLEPASGKSFWLGRERALISRRSPLPQRRV